MTDFPYPRKPRGADLAWAQPFPALLDRLRLYLRGRLGNAHEAEDVAQETFLRIWAQQQTTELQDPERYLFRVANNLVTDRYRHRARWQMEDESSLPAADDAPSAERELAARQELLLVRRAIEALPPRDRRAFELHLDGAGAAAIAAELALTRRRVEQILVTCLRRLDRARREAAGDTP